MKKWRDTYRNQFDQNRCREEARSAADWEKESMDMGEKKRSENALAETACIRKARSGLAVPAGVLLAGTAGIILAAVLPFSAGAAEKGWRTVEGTMRYVNEDGAMEKNTWIYEDGTSSMKKGWYYLGPDGKAEKNEWKKLGEVRYCFDSDGRMRTGWHYEDGEIYYLGDETEGYTRSGWHYLESDGVNRPAEGTVSRELSENDPSGKWYYFNSAGKARRAKKGVYKESDIDGCRYYFDANGVMATGWRCVKEKAEPGDKTGISRFVYLGGKGEGMLKEQWLETKERPWDSAEWKDALSDEERQTQNASETARTKENTLRRFYLKHDGTPAFLSGDAVRISDAVTKIGTARYFFDSYGVQQTGLIRMTTEGKTETAWFDPDQEGALFTGRSDSAEDKNGETFIFCAETSGSLKGTGVNGEKDGCLYYNGLLAAAPAGASCAPFKIGDRIWLADEKGRILTEEKTYKGADGILYELEKGQIREIKTSRGQAVQLMEGTALPAAGWEISYVR